MHHRSGNPRSMRVRWHANRPPMPLGCRWCGHPPYAHEAASLPHRAHHDWEQPTPKQVHARMTARRRLGLCNRPPVPTPVRPLLPPASPAVPPAFPVLPVLPGRHRRQEHSSPTSAVPHRRGGPPGSRSVPPGGHEPHHGLAHGHKPHHDPVHEPHHGPAHGHGPRHGHGARREGEPHRAGVTA